MAQKGWIKIWRQIQNEEFYKNSHALHLAIHLILKANIEDKETIFNGEKVMVKRGQCIIGIRSLAKEIGLSIKVTRTALDVLKRAQFSAQQPTHRFSIISISKYDKYQGDRAQQTAHQWATSKEDKEYIYSHEKKVRGYRPQANQLPGSSGKHYSNDFLEQAAALMTNKKDKHE